MSSEPGPDGPCAICAVYYGRNGIFHSDNLPSCELQDDCCGSSYGPRGVQLVQGIALIVE